MPRHIPLLALLLPGCLVSFNDYPLGDINAAASSASPAPSSSGSSAGGAGGSGGVALPLAGTETGGTASLPSAGESASSPEELGGGGAPPSVDNRNLIDDFEDGDAQISAIDGRAGSWYVGNDGWGVQTPTAGVPLLPVELDVERVGSTRGAHTFGGPFGTWGALIGTTLANDADAAAPYDLTRFTGLKVWVRSASTSGGGPWGSILARQVRINLVTKATSQGGGCSVCKDHFGVEIPLSSKWVQIDVPFASLKQAGFGRPQIQRNLREVMALEFLFPANVSFDLWVDDIELY